MPNFRNLTASGVIRALNGNIFNSVMMFIAPLLVGAIFAAVGTDAAQTTDIQSNSENIAALITFDANVDEISENVSNRVFTERERLYLETVNEIRDSLENLSKSQNELENLVRSFDESLNQSVLAAYTTVHFETCSHLAYENRRHIIEMPIENDSHLEKLRNVILDSGDPSRMPSVTWGQSCGLDFVFHPFSTNANDIVRSRLENFAKLSDSYLLESPIVSPVFPLRNVD